MATSTTSKSSTSAAAISAGANHTFTIPAFSEPAGCTMTRFKVTLNISNSNLTTRSIASGVSAPTKDTWYNISEAARIGWTDGSTSKVVIHNGSSGNLSCSAIVIFEYTLDKVKNGDLIKRTDRSKLGVSTTKGDLIKDSNFLKGADATASDFNSAYGL